jgi:hypothetical protein
MPKITSTLLKEVVKAAHYEVVSSTPVDTGLARSNWIVSAGTPVSLVIPPYSPGSRLGVAESQNAAAAISAGQEVIDGTSPNVTTYYVQNNVPYIGELNAGSSKQAPALFVEKGVQAGMAKAASTQLIFVI